MTTEPAATGPADRLPALRHAPAIANLELSGPQIDTISGWRNQVADDLWQLTLSWLGRTESRHTRRAYLRDITIWFDWLAGHGVDPLRARAQVATQYSLYLSAERQEAQRTRARRMAAVSSWYRYLKRNDAVASNPFEEAERPPDPGTSPTLSLTAREVDLWLAQVATEPVRNRAVLYTLYFTGLRIGSLINAPVKSFRTSQGYTVLRLRVKGGKTREVRLEPPAADAIQAHLEERGDPTSGPLIATRTGRPLAETYVVELLRRTLRQAGVKEWAQMSPHGIRKTGITELLDEGVALHIVQDWAGHADPRTTRGYDANRKSLHRSPAPRLVAAHARALKPPETPSQGEPS